MDIGIEVYHNTKQKDQKDWHESDPGVYGHYALQAKKINGRSYFKKIQLYYDSDPDSEDEGPFRDSDGNLKDLAIWSDGHEKWFIGQDQFKKENFGPALELPYSRHYNLLNTNLSIASLQSQTFENFRIFQYVTARIFQIHTFEKIHSFLKKAL